jgi:hypothetical protein
MEVRYYVLGTAGAWHSGSFGQRNALGIELDAQRVGNKKRRGPYEVPTPPGYRTSGGVG